MRRLASGLFVLFLGQNWPNDAHAQAAADPAATPGPAADATPAKKETVDDPTAGVQPGAANAAGGGVRRSGWEDIVVVPRKAVIKTGRFELMPFTGVSLNDVLIRHYAFGANISYFLSDVFSVGIEGQYFVKERTDRYRDVGLQYNQLSTLNKYNFAAALDFGYVPGYGKFSLFNRYILHWEALTSAGVGMIRSEIIPRNAADKAFTSDRLAANVGVGTRFFLSNWLTVNISLRDFIFTDLFEPQMRMPSESIDAVKKRAPSEFVNNFMLYAGVGLYLPTSFQYRMPR